MNVCKKQKASFLLFLFCSILFATSFAEPAKSTEEIYYEKHKLEFFKEKLIWEPYRNSHDSKSRVLKLIYIQIGAILGAATFVAPAIALGYVLENYTGFHFKSSDGEAVAGFLGSLLLIGLIFGGIKGYSLADEAITKLNFLRALKNFILNYKHKKIDSLPTETRKYVPEEWISIFDNFHQEYKKNDSSFFKKEGNKIIKILTKRYTTNLSDYFE